MFSMGYLDSICVKCAKHFILDIGKDYTNSELGYHK